MQVSEQSRVVTQLAACFICSPFKSGESRDETGHVKLS